MKARIFSTLKTKFNFNLSNLNIKNSKLYERFTNYRLRRNQQNFFNKKNIRINPKFLIPLLFSPFSLSKSIAFMEKEIEFDDSNNLDTLEFIKGEYENKIRMHASIEKKFMIFSGTKSRDNINMSQYQFFNCVIPFQYMKTISFDVLEKKLEKNKLFMDLYKQIDINNDKLISFEEYIIWSLIKSIDFKELRTNYPGGKITKEQLGEYLMEKTKTHSFCNITDKAAMDGRIIKTDRDTLFKVLVEFMTKTFKDHSISIDKDLVKLKVDMDTLIMIYEVKK